MTKITVHRYDSQNQPLGVDGWFDQDRAQEFVEHDPMTAERHADAIRRGQTARFGIDSLLRTEEGRWVLKMGFHIGERGKWVDDERDADRRMGYTTHRFVNDGSFPWRPGQRATLAEVRRIDDVVLLRYALSSRFGEQGPCLEEV